MIVRYTEPSCIARNNHHLPLNDPPSSRLARWRQSPRVTREPPAQHVQLVPQDARTRCNAGSPISTKCDSKWCRWVECVSLLSKGLHKCLGLQDSGLGWPHYLFVSPSKWVNRYPLEPKLRVHRCCHYSTGGCTGEHRCPLQRLLQTVENICNTSGVSLA